MAKSTLRERFLSYKKAILIICAIILLLVLGMIVTIVCMNDSLVKTYLSFIEVIFIFVFGNGIYFLLSEEVAKKIRTTNKENHLSNEEYGQFLKESKECDKFAK